MLEKDKSTLELVMPAPVKAINHFFTIKKKVDPTLCLKVEKQSALEIIEEETHTSIQNKRALHPTPPPPPPQEKGRERC